MSLFVTLLIAVLVVCIVCWAARSLLAAFSVPDPAATVVFVIVVLVCVLWFLKHVGVPGLT
jgi:hypothetical protein